MGGGNSSAELDIACGTSFMFTSIGSFPISDNNYYSTFIALN